VGLFLCQGEADEKCSEKSSVRSLHGHKLRSGESDDDSLLRQYCSIILAGGYCLDKVHGILYNNAVTAYRNV
jgi:hypothetical protein